MQTVVENANCVVARFADGEEVVCYRGSAGRSKNHELSKVFCAKARERIRAGLSAETIVFPAIRDTDEA